MNTFLGAPAVINDGHNYWLRSADGTYSRTIRCRAVRKHILKIWAGEARLEHARVRLIAGVSPGLYSGRHGNYLVPWFAPLATLAKRKRPPASFLRSIGRLEAAIEHGPDSEAE